jgi:hypothetical protein
MDMKENIKKQLAKEALFLLIKKTEGLKLDLNKFIDGYKDTLTTNEYSDTTYALRLITNAEYWLISAYKSLQKNGHAYYE